MITKEHARLIKHRVEKTHIYFSKSFYSISFGTCFLGRFGGCDGMDWDGMEWNSLCWYRREGMDVMNL